MIRINLLGFTITSQEPPSQQDEPESEKDS